MSNTKLLDDFITRNELAAELDCCLRTIARMENLPDGLPSVVLAGRNSIDELAFWIGLLSANVARILGGPSEWLLQIEKAQGTNLGLEVVRLRLLKIASLDVSQAAPLIRR